MLLNASLYACQQGESRRHRLFPQEKMCQLTEKRSDHHLDIFNFPWPRKTTTNTLTPHVLTVRPRSQAPFKWIEFTTQEDKVDFVSKLGFDKKVKVKGL